MVRPAFSAGELLGHGAARNALDLSGKRFGSLTVLAYSGQRTFPSGDTKSMWVCRCKCGETKIVIGSELTSGGTTSCGCASIEQLVERSTTHGHAGSTTRSRTYRIWQAMLNRCRNPKQPNYARYGARGITVCERWHSFEPFLKDMGECPPGHSIERERNDGNYEPGNCIWATRKTQGRNKSNNRLITFNGITKCLKEWADNLGIDQASLRERLEKWYLERALTQPGRPQRNRTITKETP